MKYIYTMAYVIRLEDFEGPIDLLLFFIQRDELDIYDIPISQITDDYLHHIQDLSNLDVNRAGEFILMAATLMKIKSHMLLPGSKESLETGEDPRAELIQNLIEYKRIKDSIVELEELQKKREAMIERGDLLVELKELKANLPIEGELRTLKMSQLQKAFLRVLDRLKDREEKKNLEVFVNSYKLEHEKELIYKKFESKKKLMFDEIFQECVNKMQAVVRFLVLLSEISAQRMTIAVGEKKNSFVVKLKK